MEPSRASTPESSLVRAAVPWKCAKFGRTSSNSMSLTCSISPASCGARLIWLPVINAEEEIRSSFVLLRLCFRRRLGKESFVRRELWRWMGGGELTTYEHESFVIETASTSVFCENEDVLAFPT